MLTNKYSQLLIACFLHLSPTSMTDPDEPKRKEKRQKGGKSGFLAPLQLSDALANFLGTGESELSRADVIKRMWDYIKGNNLQVCHCSKLSSSQIYYLDNKALMVSVHSW